MSTNSSAVAYYFAYVLAVPISAVIIGANLKQAYSTIVLQISRWGTHAVAFLCLMFIATSVQEICTAIERDGDQPLAKLLDKHRPAYVLMPINIGCIEFLVQVFFVKILYKRKSTLAGFPALICCLNFLVSWGCAIDTLMKLKDSGNEQADSANTSLPIFNIGIQIFTVWLASSTFTGLVIFGIQLYLSKQARVSGQGVIIRFFRSDNTATKLGVIALQTYAFSLILFMTLALLFFINEFAQDQAIPALSGCFVFLNLMRVPVSCATFAFTMERQEKIADDRITTLTASFIGDSMDDLSVKENKKNMLTNQVTVHTVRSEVYES